MTKRIFTPEQTERKRALGRKYQNWLSFTQEGREKKREYRRSRKAKVLANPEMAKRERDYMRRWRRCHTKKWREYQRKYMAKRLNNDIGFRIMSNLRCRVVSVLRGENKSKRTADLLGCSIESFRSYIESLFRPGMTWMNYGRTGWHLDHIKPCALFNLSDPDEQAKCFHFSNIQPLWADENIKKRDHYDEPVKA